MTHFTPLLLRAKEAIQLIHITFIIMPPKSKQKTKSKCKSCLKYERTSLWGHHMCSGHRECAQSNKWEPFKCTDCRRQKAKLVGTPKGEGTDVFFKGMYLMFHYTTQHKIRAGHVEWSYDQGLSDLFGDINVPPISQFSLFSEENIRDSQSDAGTSYCSQASVRSILANAETRKRLDKDISATISNKIDDNYQSVQEFLNSSVDNGENSPIPTFRVEKKETRRKQLKRSSPNPNQQQDPREVNVPLNNDNADNTPRSGHSDRNSNNDSPQYHNMDNNSIYSYNNFTPGSNTYYKGYDEYGFRNNDNYFNNYEDNYNYNYNSRPYYGNQYHYNNDYYDNQNLRNIHQNARPGYERYATRRSDYRSAYNNSTPYQNNYPINNRYINNRTPSGE